MAGKRIHSRDYASAMKAQRQRDRRNGIRRRPPRTGPRVKKRTDKMIHTTGESQVTRLDGEQRLAERDALAALDNRTPAQVWLNEPPAWRSALGRPCP